jgi:hypothetical protein
MPRDPPYRMAALQFHRVLEGMEIWSADSDGYSFTISFFENFAGPGEARYVASWRPLYGGRGARVSIRYGERQGLPTRIMCMRPRSSAEITSSRATPCGKEAVPIRKPAGEGHRRVPWVERERMANPSSR